jgi:hypothetical protein
MSPNVETTSQKPGTNNPGFVLVESTLTTSLRDSLVPAQVLSIVEFSGGWSVLSARILLPSVPM